MTDQRGNVFNRENISDGRYFNNNNQGYSRDFNRPNGHFRREENKPPYFPRDQSSSRPYNANQQERLNVNTEVATQHVQENKKLVIQGVPLRNFPNKMDLSDKNK
jgi:hypothetical protein